MGEMSGGGRKYLRAHHLGVRHHCAGGVGVKHGGDEGGVRSLVASLVAGDRGAHPRELGVAVAVGELAHVGVRELGGALLEGGIDAFSEQSL